jgi:5-deoxy-glucuronate isomerase
MSELVRQERGFPTGYTALCEVGGRHAGMGMDFGILRLGAGQKHVLEAGRERACVLLGGNVELEWDGGRAAVARGNVFDDEPSCLHVPATGRVTITAKSAAELSLHATDNARSFAARLYKAQDVRSDERGKGTMRETSTRIVRTIVDDTNAPQANLVLGEAVTFPGKWSSYPPHHHPQPEIYHYRFLPENGFGLTALGPDAFQLRHLDTAYIRAGEDHPQVAAPGYAMYYLWAIRHLEGDRYGTPEFTKEHAWVMDPKARIWP